jgi:hypothetical protein
MITHTLDRFSLGELFLVTVAIMVAFIEIGYRFETRPKGKAVEAQATQVRAIVSLFHLDNHVMVERLEQVGREPMDWQQAGALPRPADG